jgi:hypothetical protein
MGAFNTVRATAVCPSCEDAVPVVVQFKYGNTRQFEYKLGDELCWGGNQIGTPGKRRVVLEGVVENSCAVCGADREWSIYLFVENDRLVSAETADGRYDFGKEGRTYLVLDE